MYKDKHLGARFAGISALDDDYVTRTNLTKEFNIKYMALFYINNTIPKKANRIMFDEFSKMSAASYSSKISDYNLNQADLFVIGISLETKENINKDNSICILFDGEYSIGNIPNISNKGQILWENKTTNKYPSMYCHEILKL